MKSVGVFLFVTALAYSAFACQPLFRIYEAENEGGVLADLMIVLDEKNTSSKNINNTNVYTCVEGLWMGYEWELDGGQSWLATGRDIYECRHENDGRIFKSVKVVGSPEDYTASAVVTYLNMNNEWADTTYLGDTEQLNNTRFNSLIVVGHEEVELFSGSEFQGRSFCIRPNNGMIHKADEFDAINDRLNGTEMYTDLTNLIKIFNQTQFNSLRFGCGYKKA